VITPSSVKKFFLNANFTFLDINDFNKLSSIGGVCFKMEIIEQILLADDIWQYGTSYARKN